MTRERSLRSQLYRDARILGNIEAAVQGPEAFAKRTVRRKVYKQTNKITRSILRGFGLSR